MSDVTIWVLSIAIAITIAAVLSGLIYRRMNRRINELNQQIAELRRSQEREALRRIINTPAANGAAQPLPTTAPLPARSKRHLHLYKGGSVAAIVTALGASARSAWRAHHHATIAATVTAGAVAAALLYATSDDMSDTDDLAPPGPSATAPPDPSDRPAASSPPTASNSSAEPAPRTSRPTSGPTAPTPSLTPNAPAPATPSVGGAMEGGPISRGDRRGRSTDPAPPPGLDHDSDGDDMNRNPSLRGGSVCLRITVDPLLTASPCVPGSDLPL